MVGYVMMGTNDLKRAGEFYDELLAELGASRSMDMESFIAWGTTPEAALLSITKPADGNPATVGNGVMVALLVDSKDKVAALHKKALELGGKNEGAPGPRGEGFYAGYFRDLDGNKLNAFFIG
ncbi:MAG: VOC family protein [bacterium]|nr:VOC family protein [bacterium]